MRVYFVRHGESEANLTRIFSNRGDGPGLTARGREQATALAEKLRPEGITTLWCSPLLRARQTASVVADRIGLTCQTTESLREFDVGCYEGTSGETGWQEYAEVGLAWRDGDRSRSVGGGETLLDIMARFEPFLRDVIAAAAPADRVVLLGHGGLFRDMLPLVLRDVSPAFACAHVLAPTEYIAAEWDGESLACVEWAGEAYR